MSEYLLRAAPDYSSIELWATARLPLEPRDWRARMRDELRAALRALPPTDDGVLEATYSSEDPGFFDVENLLFYNVGTGCFGHLARKGLAFRRSRVVPPRPDGLPAMHHHRYSLVAPDRSSIDGAVLAEYRFHLPALSTSTKPHAVWWAMKNGEAIVHAREPHLGPFSLRVTLAVHGGTALNLAAVMKPLFDGIICAAQSQLGEIDPTAIERLGRVLGVRPEQVAAALEDAAAPLGPGALVSSYREFVKWNPADERCEEGELLTEPASARGVEVRAELLRIPIDARRA